MHAVLAEARRSLPRFVLALGLALALATRGGAPARSGTAAATFAWLALDAVQTLESQFYAGDGRWRTCLAAGCAAVNQDWGADALTFTLYLAWASTHDPTMVPFFRALAASAPTYGPCRGTTCRRWSDVPEWDAIAALREFDVTRERHALERAEAAFASVERSDAFARGACADIDYQHPFGGGGGLKTLETDANAVKAALLLFRFTARRAFLTVAVRRYAAIRRRFLDPAVALYTVYVVDDGKRCTQIPRRFFASVNGDMIWNGAALAAITRDRRYRADALATARAVDRWLSDGRRIFVDLQAENDVAEPLVEARGALAASGDAASRGWIMRNGDALPGARRPDGTYGRFIDGPAGTAPATAWQANGGLALAIVAGSIAPAHAARPDAAWDGAAASAVVLSKLPATYRFHGSGIALLGTLGEVCCEGGHARVLLDGRETFDATGVWQNKSSANRSFSDSVLFAWRWADSRDRTITLLPGTRNVKEGGPFAHVTGELVVP